MTAYSPSIEGSDPYQVPPQTARYQTMAWAIGGLRQRRKGQFPVALVLLIVGGLCLTGGFAAIIVGWYGAAHTVELYEQNPYLISGGILGLGLVMTGGFLYFGYWLTRQHHVSQVTLQQLSAGLANMDHQLAQMAATNAKLVEMTAMLVPVADPEPRRYDPSAPVVVATARGSLFHSPDCPAVAKKEGVRPVDPDDPRYRPCQICSPRSVGAG